MKKLLFVIFLFFALSARAQTTFAPPGSSWYNSMAYGVFHSYYSGETTMLGITCRAIVQEAINIPDGYPQAPVYNLPTLYVYNTADTVFVYNIIFNRFTPLYVFNVNAGDTIRLPIFPSIDCSYPNIAPADSTFKIVVDSVKMVVYDTATLKTVYSHPIGNLTTDFVYDYGGVYGDTAEGAYAERIGCIGIGFLPIYLSSGVNLLDESCVPPDSLRCYHDSTLSINLLPGICDDPPTSVKSINSTTAINIFPDPASDIVHISCSILAGNMNISIVGMDGKEVLNQTSNNNTTTEINVAQLPPGIYLLKLHIDNDAPAYKKINILH